MLEAECSLQNLISSMMAEFAEPAGELLTGTRAICITNTVAEY